MSNAVQIRVKEIDFFQRPVTLRLPFRFGIVTLTEAPQAFVRVRVENQRGQSAWGAAAEMLAPKWLDKNPALSNEDNFDQLRRSLSLTREGYLADSSPRTAFALFADHYPQQTAACAAEDLNELVASFGPAVIDRAILDALCRLENITYQEAIRHNLPAIDPAQLSPDLAGFDLTAWLASLKPRNNIYARHTVGLVDPITAAEQENPVQDGLPETLEEVIAAYGQRYFKLKVGGDVEADIDRLSRIAAVLDRSPEPYYATLDGNEQYADSEGILALWQALSEKPGLQRLAASILFIEQPISRTNALSQDIHRLSAAKPVIIDESDAAMDSFVQAKALGYRGVSSKNCKGVYRSLLNYARCAQWNSQAGGEASFFMSGEDLTTQAGLSVQQDLAQVCLLGLTHVERNGHHYVDGFGTAPEAEAEAFLNAHPGLYQRQNQRVRLRIAKGLIDTHSLQTVGFAHPDTAQPDWDSMETFS